MRQRARRTRSATGVERGAVAAEREPHDGVLQLQRTAGNAAVAAVLGARPAGVQREEDDDELVGDELVGDEVNETVVDETPVRTAPVEVAPTEAVGLEAGTTEQTEPALGDEVTGAGAGAELAARDDGGGSASGVRLTIDGLFEAMPLISARRATGTKASLVEIDISFEDGDSGQKLQRAVLEGTTFARCLLTSGPHPLELVDVMVTSFDTDRGASRATLDGKPR